MILQNCFFRRGCLKSFIDLRFRIFWNWNICELLVPHFFHEAYSSKHIYLILLLLDHKLVWKDGIFSWKLHLKLRQHHCYLKSRTKLFFFAYNYIVSIMIGHASHFLAFLEYIWKGLHHIISQNYSKYLRVLNF